MLESRSTLAMVLNSFRKCTLENNGQNFLILEPRIQSLNSSVCRGIVGLRHGLWCDSMLTFIAVYFISRWDINCGDTKCTLLWCAKDETGHPRKSEQHG